jgi:hypothetical protein
MTSVSELSTSAACRPSALGLRACKRTNQAPVVTVFWLRMLLKHNADVGGAVLLPFSPQSDLVETRARLRVLVDDVVAKLSAGVLPSEMEREHLDIKEEAGRRGSGGLLMPGRARNLAAADQFAHEVTCLANTGRRSASRRCRGFHREFARCWP